MKIADRAVLITGANRGIGQALVEEALRRGAKRVYAGTRQPLGAPGWARCARDPGRDERSADYDVPKASPESVAQAIFDGMEKGEEEIFPDPMSASLADGWRSGAVKALERQFATYAEASPVKT